METIERLSEEAKSIYSIDPSAVIKGQISFDEIPSGLRGKNDRISRFVAPFREIEKRLIEKPGTAVEINVALFNGRTPGGHVQSVLRKNFPNLKMVQRAKRIFLIRRDIPGEILKT